MIRSIPSIQGYETAPVEDSSDDLWYLETSSAGAIGIGVESSSIGLGVDASVTGVDQDFQVEFEVESSTEVDDDEEEDEEDESEEDDDEDEDLLGEEVSAFLSIKFDLLRFCLITLDMILLFSDSL